MEQLDRLNKALDYIEQHLTGELDYEELGRISYCSSYHFQRIFSFIAGVPVAEYVRRRKLTMAAMDLQSGNEKVLDIALKYGYDSPTSFTRAFQNLHGVTPKTAKEMGTKLKSFPRITFQLSIKGELEMNYKIVEKKEIRFVGVKEAVSSVNGENFRRIPEIWKETVTNGKFQKLFKISNGDPSGVMGICANFREHDMDYYIASSSDMEVPAGMEELKVPALTWVVFECIGPTPSAIQAVWQRIFTEWFPNSGYEHAMGPEIEWYSDGDVNADDYLSEIWIPVVKA